MTERSTPRDNLRNYAEEPKQDSGLVEAYGLTQKEVERLRRIIAKEFGVVLSNAEAWQRAIELMAFAKILLESLPPGRPDSAPSRPRNGASRHRSD